MTKQSSRSEARGTCPVFVALKREMVQTKSGGDHGLASHILAAVLIPVEARQGYPVLMVLIASTLLVCVAFGIARLTT